MIISPANQQQIRKHGGTLENHKQSKFIDNTSIKKPQRILRY